MNLEQGSKIQVLAPVVRGRKGEFKKLLENFSKEGFVRARIDGETVELTDDIDIDRKRKHYINSEIKEYLGSYYNSFKALENIKDANCIQARMPFDPNIQ